jgi:hypothetical protein
VAYVTCINRHYDRQLVTEDKQILVYNFEVDETHTYFVSPLEVLVHNACQCVRRNAQEVNEYKSNEQEGQERLMLASGTTNMNARSHHLRQAEIFFRLAADGRQQSHLIHSNHFQEHTPNQMPPPDNTHQEAINIDRFIADRAAGFSQNPQGLPPNMSREFFRSWYWSDQRDVAWTWT